MESKYHIDMTIGDVIQGEMEWIKNSSHQPGETVTRFVYRMTHPDGLVSDIHVITTKRA